MANRIQISENDRKAAIELLGREPRAPFSVKTRCPDGSPQVLLADPVFCEDGIWKPFPTFLWLICPFLKLIAAHAEQAGMVKEFSQRLQNDEVFKIEFIQGQRQVSELRIKMAEEILGNEIPEHILVILSETTIAGSIDISGVKCLHAHMAQELAFGNNPIGREILAANGSCNGNHERKQS